MKKILFVCHGNICRSPMAEFVMRDMAKREKIDVYVSSAATSNEEIGNPVHRGTRVKLAEFGIDTSGKYAVRMTKEDYEKYDYIIGMDSANIRNIMYIIGEDNESKVSKLLSFAGSDKDISDPWYTGDFDKTYEDVYKGCKGFIEKIKRL